MLHNGRVDLNKLGAQATSVAAEKAATKSAKATPGAGPAAGRYRPAAALPRREAARRQLLPRRRQGAAFVEMLAQLDKGARVQLAESAVKEAGQQAPVNQAPDSTCMAGP